jgi:hypothetical protein
MSIAAEPFPEDVHRRRAALAGASGGGTLGLMAGMLLNQGLLTGAAVVVVGLLGAVTSAVLATRFDIVEWEPGEGHPHVGAKAPDDDLAQP